MLEPQRLLRIVFGDEGNRAWGDDPRSVGIKGWDVTRHTIMALESISLHRFWTFGLHRYSVFVSEVFRANRILELNNR